MRPINKGKVQKIKGTYRHYFDDLKDIIGKYCSYCERRRDKKELAIEHIRGKAPYPEYECCWDNLLLSCTTCNLNKENCDKGVKDVNDLTMHKYVFPHIHDTYHLINYLEPTYMPAFNEDADPKYKSSVENLIKVLQMRNADCLTEEQLIEEEELPALRIRMGRYAKQLKEEYIEKRTTENYNIVITSIEREIKNVGFWSIWMKAFEDVEEIKNYLLDLLPGTEKRYFENNPEIRDQCEHEHIYKDIVGTLEHRLNYIKQKGQVAHSEEWSKSIEAEIEKRLPDMTEEEKKQIQKYLEEIKSK